jgi:hypothetical protein
MLPAIDCTMPFDPHAAIPVESPKKGWGDQFKTLLQQIDAPASPKYQSRLLRLVQAETQHRRLLQSQEKEERGKLMWYSQWQLDLYRLPSDFIELPNARHGTSVASWGSEADLGSIISPSEAFAQREEPFRQHACDAQECGCSVQ